MHMHRERQVAEPSSLRCERHRSAPHAPLHPLAIAVQTHPDRNRTCAAGDPAVPRSDREGEAHLREGERRTAAGEPEHALTEFASALLADPTNREAYYALAACLEQQGRWKDAERIYRRCAKVLPEERAATERMIRAVRSSARASAGGSPRRGLSEERQPVAPDQTSPADAAKAASTRSSEFVAPRAPRTGPARSLTRLRPPRVLAGPSTAEPSESVVRPRARIVGLLSFPIVLATYVVVGLAVHVLVGLAAAVAVGLALAAVSSLLLSRLRWPGFVGVLHGMVWGVYLTIGAGILSIAIAAVRQPQTPPGTGMWSDPIQIVIPLRWLECASGVGDPAWCGEETVEGDRPEPADGPATVEEAADGLE
jgi:hypothetical protein